MKTGKSTKSVNVFFRLTCFLLVITSFTCIALARYVSSLRLPSDIGIANFACSINLNVNRADSAYSFFNSEFQINGIEMNTTQSTLFTVNNCNLNEDGSYSAPCDVDLKYDLMFYVPQEFAPNAGIQFSIPEKLEESTGLVAEKEKAATPFYRLADFLGTSPEVTEVTAKGDFSETITDGETQTTITYGSLPYAADETFTRTANADTIREWKTDDGVSFLIEKIYLPAEVRYAFQCFTGNPEHGEVHRLAPLYLSRAENQLAFYKIRYSRPDFVLKKGARDDDTYNLRTILMKSFISSDESEHGDPLKDILDGKLPGAVDSLTWKNKACTVAYLPSSENPKVDTHMFRITTIENGQPIAGVEPQDAYITSFIQKDYPTRLNAVFTQTKLATAES